MNTTHLWTPSSSHIPCQVPLRTSHFRSKITSSSHPRLGPMFSRAVVRNPTRIDLHRRRPPGGIYTSSPPRSRWSSRGRSLIATDQSGSSGGGMKTVPYGSIPSTRRVRRMSSSLVRREGEADADAARTSDNSRRTLMSSTYRR
jgi:hypothetical protein